MKILGVDISSRSTGLGLIEGDKLLEYTKINPTGTMSNSAKMFLFSVELEKLIQKYQPDYIAVEDVIQVSSVSITKILARFNGVALVSAYKYNKTEPRLFIPSEWKKIIGLHGIVKKCETQLFVCKKFKLLTEEKISYYQKKIDEVFSLKEDSNIQEERKNLDLLKKMKKKEKDKEKLVQIEKDIKDFEEKMKKSKKGLKNIIDKKFDEISMEIYIETSINEDVADAVGVALSYQKELNTSNK